MRHGKDVKVSGPFERGPGKSVVLPPSILLSKMDNTKSKSVASFEDVLAIPWAACIALLVRLSHDLSPGCTELTFASEYMASDYGDIQLMAVWLFKE